MAAVPEFIARRTFIKDSFEAKADGFAFRLTNPFTAITVTQFSLKVNGEVISPDRVLILNEAAVESVIPQPQPDQPFVFQLHQPVRVQVAGPLPENPELFLSVVTREVGEFEYRLPVSVEGVAGGRAKRWHPRHSVGDFLLGPQRAILRLDYDETIGETNPYIFGHFIEHLENSIYGGIWTEDGKSLREDVLRLIQPMKPTVIRYPGGNFASAYHWEDGIGPKDLRPLRYDPAWKVNETNQVGTDEFMELCARTGAEPYLCVNDATGTPEEAARWVAYCNEDKNGEQGRRRAANGHPDPYRVRLWGVGNEVWGTWQTGHTDAAGYVQRLRSIIEAMRKVDPTIKIVAVGNTLPEDDDPEARRWNETVLRGAGDLIDYLSFHLYQPGQEGWQELPDQKKQYFSLVAAPLSAEKAVQRLAEMIGQLVPHKPIRVALDEWNVWPAPPPDAASMHAVRYTMRDALYCAGMLNAFIRQSKNLALANLAQMVNVLGLICTDQRQAYATPIYYPFVMYRQMESIVLKAEVTSPTFASEKLGNIEAMKKVPAIDVAATRSPDGRRVILGIVNRHPTRRVDLSVRLRGFSGLHPSRCWLLRHTDPLAENSFSEPEKVKAKEVDLRQIGGRSRFTLDLPECSVSVITLEE